ncbi:MAG: hypothetical protein V1696_03280 [Candidatus Jorgensenbacteria bacterium]
MQPQGEIALASRRAVALLGLGTASRCRVLAAHRSDVRFSTQSAQALRFGAKIKKAGQARFFDFL